MIQIYARPNEDLLYLRIQYWRKKYEDHQERCFMPPREQPSLATSLQRLVELMATRQQNGNQRNDANSRNVSRFPYTNANRPSFRSNNNNNNNTFSFRRNNNDRNTNTNDNRNDNRANRNDFYNQRNNDTQRNVNNNNDNNNDRNTVRNRYPQRYFFNSNASNNTSNVNAIECEPNTPDNENKLDF